jgi:alanyl-tRNA synthetase
MNMTRKQYLADPLLTSWTAKVLQVSRGENTLIRLDRTIFHPQGGGQKADRGRIGPAVVIHVSHNADGVDHHVSTAGGLEPGMEVPLEIDSPWRQLNAAYHTAGHLLASVVESLYPGLHAITGHQWPGEARVEFDGSVPVTQLATEAINGQLAADLAADLPVVIEGDPFKDRSIRIGRYKPIPCGGTHVTSLAVLSAVVVKSVKAKSGRIRMSYDASHGGSI